MIFARLESQAFARQQRTAVAFSDDWLFGELND
jgi:hypothetical protein